MKQLSIEVVVQANDEDKDRPVGQDLQLGKISFQDDLDATAAGILSTSTTLHGAVVNVSVGNIVDSLAHVDIDLERGGERVHLHMICRTCE